MDCTAAPRAFPRVVDCISEGKFSPDSHAPAGRGSALDQASRLVADGASAVFSYPNRARFGFGSRLDWALEGFRPAKGDISRFDGVTFLQHPTFTCDFFATPYLYL